MKTIKIPSLDKALAESLRTAKDEEIVEFTVKQYETIEELRRRK
jgi:hypothetical protein